MFLFQYLNKKAPLVLGIAKGTFIYLDFNFHLFLAIPYHCAMHHLYIHFNLV